MSEHDTEDMCGENTDRGYNMTTASGKPFWPASPRAEDVRTSDVALHLGRLCRFNGGILPCKMYTRSQALKHIEKYPFYSPFRDDVSAYDSTYLSFEIYSVAQHSVHVYEAVAKESDDPDLLMAALMHDASEYVLGDMIKPQKWMYKERKVWENQVDLVIAEKYKFDPALFSHPLIKKADYQAVLTEHRDLHSLECTVDWGTAMEEPWEDAVIPMLPSCASGLFLSTFNKIQDMRK